MKICPLCESKAEDDLLQCRCGHRFDDNKQVKELEEKYKSPVLKKRSRTGAVITAIVIALCLIGGTVGGFFAERYFSKVRLNGKFDGVLIFENNQLLCADASRPKAKPMLIADFEGNTENMSHYYEHYMSPDNKKMVFSNNYSIDESTYESTYDLFLYDLENQQQQIKFASGVSSFCVNEGFDTVTCLKGEGRKGCLGQYDMITGNGSIISDNVEKYSVSKDGTTVIYQSFDGDIFVYTKGGSSVPVHKKSDVVDVKEDFSSFLFVTGTGNLASYDISTKKKTVIDKKVTQVYFSGGKGYYTTEAKAFSLKDYFTDDMLESDEWISTRSEEYESRLMRDSIRRQINSTKYDIKLYNLHYFDGENTSVVDENIRYFSGDTSGENDCGAYGKIDTLKIKKIKMSEIADSIGEGKIYLLRDYLLDISGEAEESIYICAGEKKSGKLQNIKGVDGICYNKKEKALYFYSSDGKNATVYSAKEKTSTVSVIEVVSENVMTDGVYFTEDGDCFYLKKQTGSPDRCDLYFNGSLVKSNLNAYFRCGENTWFIVRDKAKTEKDKFTYTLIESSSVYSFESDLDIDSSSARRTENGAYILKDEHNTIVVRGEKVKKGSVIPEVFFVPRYPEAVICEINTDFSRLIGTDIELMK